MVVKHTWRTIDDVQPWVDENGIEELRAAVAEGRLGGGRLDAAKAYIECVDRKALEHEKRTETNLLTRSTSASESQARTARWAFVISIAALIISIVALFKKS